MMNKKFVLQATILLLIVGWFFSCTQVDIYAPIGPKGEKGDKGDRGQSTYELWKEKVANGTIEWNKDEVSESDFFRFLKGKDGKDGQDGQNGVSAYEQWKEYIASGDVDDPHNDGKKWDPKKNTVQDFWAFLMGRPGADGKTPYIKDGNWWIGDTDLGVPARGEDGHSPVIIIGENGNWWIDGRDTGKPARGPKGDQGPKGQDGQDGNDGNNGENGKSAYELWVDEVKNNCGKSTQVMDPHNPTQPWDCDRVSFNDFMEFLRGQKGEQGEDGVVPGTIIKGKYNVLPQYYNATLGEYVDPSDGSVVFAVFDKEGAKAPAGSTVKGLPGIPGQTFTTDSNGEFRVTRDQLPERLLVGQRRGITDEVTINGVMEPSAKNTIVPNRINTRITANFVYLRQPTAAMGAGSYPNAHFTVISYKYEREVDGQWVAYPELFPKPEFAAVFVNDPASPVNEGNITDSAESQRWGINKSYADFNEAKNSFMIVRPVVLSDTEKNGNNPPTDITDFGTYTKRFNEVKKYEWDNNDKYFSMKGTKFFYGQNPILPQAIHVPEIYPMVEFKNDTKIDIVQGVTTIWGELDMDKLPEAYIKYEMPASETAPWRPVKITGQQLKAQFQQKVMAKIFTFGKTGAQLTQTYTDIPWKKGHAKFSTRSVYPKYVLSTMMYIEDDLKGKTTLGTPNDYVIGAIYAPYRALPYYILEENSGNYHLKYIFGVKPDFPLPKQSLPVDWTN